MKISKDPINFVAFDWNGTLFADTVYCVEACNAVFKKFKVPQISLQRYQSTYLMPFYRFFELNGFNNLEQIKAGAVLFHEHYEPLVTKARTRRGAREILDWFEKNEIKRGIFSNHTAAGLDAQLNRLNLKDLFEVVLTGRPAPGVGKWIDKKKNLAAYIKKYKHKPKNILVVGDTAEEILIGKDLGAKTIAITGGANSTQLLKEAKPDEIISTLNELKEFI